MGVHSLFSNVYVYLRSTLGAIGHCRDGVTGVSPTSASNATVRAASNHPVASDVITRSCSPVSA
jgi:hypothetical protein